MNRRTISALLGLLLLGSGVIACGGGGGGDGVSAQVAEGHKLFKGTCAACHGQNGISIAPDYPNLACQKEKYLVKSLKAYKSGARNDPLMKPMVMALSAVPCRMRSCPFAFE